MTYSLALSQPVSILTNNNVPYQPTETIIDNHITGSSGGTVSIVNELHAPPKTSKTTAIIWGIAAVVLVVGSFNVYLFFFYRHNQGGLGAGLGRWPQYLPINHTLVCVLNNTYPHTVHALTHL